MIAPGRKVNLPLYHPMTGKGIPYDIEFLVNNVAQTFNMSKKAKEALREVVIEYIPDYSEMEDQS